MTNPFEFFIHHIRTTVRYQDIIQSITLSDSSEIKFGREYYRIYIDYEFKESALSYMNKEVSKLNKFDDKNYTEPQLTKLEKLYESFITTKHHVDGFDYVGFNKEYYTKSQLNKICDDMIPELEKTLKEYAPKVEDKTNHYTIISKLYKE